MKYLPWHRTVAGCFRSNRPQGTRSGCGAEIFSLAGKNTSCDITGVIFQIGRRGGVASSLGPIQCPVLPWMMRRIEIFGASLITLFPVNVWSTFAPGQMAVKSPACLTGRKFILTTENYLNGMLLPG